MRRAILQLLLIFTVFLGTGTGFLHPVKKGLMNMNSPGFVPEIFAPGVVSSGFHEHSGFVMTKTMDEGFYSIAWYEPTLIMHVKKRGDKWGDVEVAPFSGRYPDDDPMLGPEGKKLYFMSKRPIIDGKRKAEKEYNVWFVEKDINGKWGTPTYHPGISRFKGRRGTFARNGNYYFCRPKGTIGGWDIYRSRYVDGKYSEAENLGGEINSSSNDFSGQIAPDESFLIYSSIRPELPFGMYISFRKDSGGWTQPRYFGKAINQGRVERFATLSPNGKYLFFNRQYNRHPEYSENKLSLADLKRKQQNPQNGFGDIYWVDARVIERMRDNE